MMSYKDILQLIDRIHTSTHPATTSVAWGVLCQKWSTIIRTLVKARSHSLPLPGFNTVLRRRPRRRASRCIHSRKLKELCGEGTQPQVLSVRDQPYVRDDIRKGGKTLENNLTICPAECLKYANNKYTQYSLSLSSKKIPIPSNLSLRTITRGSLAVDILMISPQSHPLPHQCRHLPPACLVFPLPFPHRARAIPETHPPDSSSPR